MLERFPLSIQNTRCELRLLSLQNPHLGNTNLCGSLRRILAANRDEVLDRPTEHARFRHSFKDHVESVGHVGPDILCGLDLRAGGTWLGLNKTSGCITFLYVGTPLFESVNPMFIRNNRKKQQDEYYGAARDVRTLKGIPGLLSALTLLTG